MIFTPKWTFYNGNACTCCTREENWKVLSSYFRTTLISNSFRLFIGFPRPLCCFPYRARIKTGNSFYFSKKRLTETNTRNIFLTTAIRELINYELTFFPDKQLRSTCPSNEGSRFLETYVTKTSVNPLLFPLRQRKN